MTRTTRPPLGVLLAVATILVGLAVVGPIPAGPVQDPPKEGEAEKDPVLIPPKAADLTKTALRLIELHNKERAKKELGPLEADQRLFDAAKRHAEDMAKHEHTNHEGTDKTTMIERARESGYTFRFLAENIAAGMKTPELAVKAWMSSPGHQANILNGDYTQVGVAVARSKKGHPYWCTVFGKPLREPARKAGPAS